MVQILTILVFASLHMAAAMPEARLWHGPHWAVWCLVWAPLALAWGSYHALTKRCGRLMDERGDLRAFLIADTAMSRLRIAAVLWFSVCSIGLGWEDAVRGTIGRVYLLGDLVAAAPAPLFFMAMWSSMYPLDLRIREASLLRLLDSGRPVYPPLSRWEYVWSCTRHQMLIVVIPMALVTAWDEALAWSATRYGASAAWWPGAEPWLQWTGIVLVLACAPALVRRLWDTVLIASGPVRERAKAMFRRYRVRVRGPFLWRTHGAMVNGAILGIVWPMRYLLLTDALLDQLSDEQVDGVLAHEVAHVKERHLIWLGVCVLGAVMATGWVTAGAAYAANLNTESEAVGLWASVLSLASAALVFGHVSRRFEWQADAFAARHLSELQEQRVVTPEAANTMASALQAVADLNGIPIARFSWRHGSISHRQNRLLSLVGSPLSQLPINTRVRWIKLAGVAALGASLAPLLWELVTR